MLKNESLRGKPCGDSWLFASRSSRTEFSQRIKIATNLLKQLVKMKIGGILQTSAQVTVHYRPDALVGRQILGRRLTHWLRMGKSYFDEKNFPKFIKDTQLFLAAGLALLTTGTYMHRKKSLLSGKACTRKP